MVTLDTRVRVSHDVFARDFDGEVFVVDLRRGDYFGLDGLATRVWEGLIAGKTLREIADVLVDDYDVDLTRLQADLVRLLEDLVNRGLVVES